MGTNKVISILAIVVSLFVVCLWASYGWADEGVVEAVVAVDEGGGGSIGHLNKDGVWEEGAIQSICPKTFIKDPLYCFRCHVIPSFALKESEYGEGMVLQKWLSSRDGKKYVNYEMAGVDGSVLDDMIMIRNYVSEHPGEIKLVVMDILSGGGSLFIAWDVVGVMSELKAEGVVVETRCRGFAASAAFLIFASGQDRVASPTAEFMWHEAKSFAMFDEKNPSKLRDEARIFRHLQDTANNHLAGLSKASKEFLDKSIDKDELWLTGAEMVEMGFADRLIGSDNSNGGIPVVDGNH